MRRPPARSLIASCSDLYSFYVELEWAAREREAELEALPRDRAERRAWEVSELRRTALMFLLCHQAIGQKWPLRIDPPSLVPRESDAAFFSAWLDLQSAHWSSQAVRGTSRAEAAARLAIISDASAAFHRRVGQCPEVVRERAMELDLDQEERGHGLLRWDPEHGLQVEGGQNPHEVDPSVLLARLVSPDWPQKGER